MLFNSLEFALFLPTVFLIYWFVFNRKLRLQNFFIVAVSYLFYGWWDWRFLLLIAFTTAASYFSGTCIQSVRNRPNKGGGRDWAKYIAASNIVLNLLILCLFKYFNFFSENLGKLFEVFGYTLDWVTLDVLLPVGISFYTFQALSYTIDVYKNKLEPTHDIVSFFAYVSFFPQLVAGPIERATNLLPQFYVKRHFDYAKAIDGMRQILWGLFKKIVVADTCAVVANDIFANYSQYNSSTLLLGALLFSFQIYGDFSGYSDIAIGTARLFGFDLMRNFNFPYFSRDIAEFWRRWHISLTTWFRDYIYIPLGGSRLGKWISLRNTLIIFLVSGLWHGANWTFVAWGAYHAILFIPLLLLGKNRNNTTHVVAEKSILPSLKELAQMLFTFLLVLIGWIIFRAENMTDGLHYIARLFTQPPFAVPQVRGMLLLTTLESLLYISVLLLVEWINRRQEQEFSLQPSNTVLRWGLYLLIGFVVFISFKQGQGFIYFQF